MVKYAKCSVTYARPKIYFLMREAEAATNSNSIANEYRITGELVGDRNDLMRDDDQLKKY